MAAITVVICAQQFGTCRWCVKSLGPTSKVVLTDSFELHVASQAQGDALIVNLHQAQPPNKVRLST